MTCESLADAILDMARGAAMPEPSRRRAVRHLESCPACALAYDRQRELTAALQALAADAQAWRAPAAMEQRLLAEFAERQAEPVPVPAAAAWWKYALPAAAAIVLAVWGGMRARPGTEVRLKAEATPQARAAAARPHAGSEAIRAEAGRVAGGPVATPRTSTRRASTAAPAVRPKPKAPQVDGARTATTRAAAATTAASVAAVEFIRIPSAIGLPEMESGTVVRVELPLTALPSYGLDIAPDAAHASVQADVLVGQDGQPRAIRLVGSPDAVAPDSRSRQ